MHPKSSFKKNDLLFMIWYSVYRLMRDLNRFNVMEDLLDLLHNDKRCESGLVYANKYNDQ